MASVLWGPSVAVTEEGAREFSMGLPSKGMNPILEGSTYDFITLFEDYNLPTYCTEVRSQHEHMGLGEINSIQQLCTIALIIN